MLPSRSRPLIRLLRYVLLLLCCTSAAAASAISIDVGSATTTPGGTALFSVKLQTTGAEVVGTQNVIGFAAPIRIAARADGQPDCTVGPGIHKNATGFRFLPNGCADAGCTSVRAVVLAFDNSDPIPDGSVLYTCHAKAEPDAAPGDYPLLNSDLGASDGAGVFLNAAGSAGSIHVRASGTAIDVEDAESVPGGSVLVDVRLRSPGATVVAAQNRIDYAPPLHIAARANGDPDCAVNAAIDKAASGFRFVPSGCTGDACTAVRAAVLSFDNVAPIPNGALLYRCRVTIDDDAAAGSFPLRNSETAGSDAHGVLVPASGRDAALTVLADTAAVAIDVGTVRAVSGQRAIVPVSLRVLDGNAGAVAGTQNEIVFDPTAPIAAREDGTPDCVANPDIHKSGTDFLFLPVDCTPGLDCERVRAFVLALDNTDPIPDGSDLYRCAVQVASQAPVGIYPLRNDNALASDPSGDPVQARGGSGQVEVICAGDCDANGQVAIFELLRGVNILLDNDALSTCQALDADRSGDVNVNELVQAVSSALRGCTFTR